VAKFNLRGPDLTATELALDLQPFTRPLVIINAASASAPFMNLLKGPDRIVVTSTRSGYQQNYARFGLYLAEAIADPRGDLDKDGQTSVLEAYISAAQSVAEFYKTEARLATEHALLDDNGDGRGTPADWFRRASSGGGRRAGWHAGAPAPPAALGRRAGPLGRGAREARRN
jgi:hypothetical protein